MRYLFLLAALLASSAHAVDLDAGVGICQAHGLSDGTWWQSQFGFQGQLKPPCFDLGISDKFERGGAAGWRIGYADLGRITADVIGTIHDNETYQPGVPCDKVTGKNCVAHFAGRGGVFGLSAGVFRDVKAESITIRPEAGAYLYHSWWNETVTCNNCPAFYPAEQTPAGASGNHASLYLGLRAEYSHAFLALKYFDNIREQSAQNTGLTHGPVVMTTVGVSF